MIVRVSEATRAYVASVVDMHGVLRERELSNGTILPSIAVNAGQMPMLNYLGKLTGTKAIVTRRNYMRAGCSEHCKEKHLHVVSASGRWGVTGVKATVVLWNVWPFMKVQQDEARHLVALGIVAPFKGTTVRKMAELGWETPEFGPRRLGA